MSADTRADLTPRPTGEPTTHPTGEPTTHPTAGPVTDAVDDPALRARAEEHLRALVGSPAAAFRDGQWEAVRALVGDRSRVLVVQRTGWGKSAVYFVATRLLRERGAGPTVIVSPLLALMRDQIAAAARAGVRAVTVNSANAHAWEEVAEALAGDAVDVLLISPERLNNPRFREEWLPGLVARVGLLVVDEAHCISDWGHDFRPDYRRIRTVLAGLAPGTPVLATTATANARVVADVEEQLAAPTDGTDHGPHPVTTLRGPLARASLRLGCLDLGPATDRLGWLAAHLGELPGSGIVYALTVSAAEETADFLTGAGYRVRAYTGRTDPEERERIEGELRENRVKALVATSALGMGFDKPDLGFVVHLGAPSSPVAYYQQVGRAGRATDRADVLLLPGPEDRDIWEYFATAAMPLPEQARAVLAALEGGDGAAMSTPLLETVTSVRRTRLELLLKVLDVEGAVAKVGGGWVSTGRPWTYDAERYARVAQVRREEAAAMLAYERGGTCRMRFLSEALDDAWATDCGRCDVCAGAWYPRAVPDGARAAAAASLDRVGVPLAPRAQWPSGMDRLGIAARGRIPADEQAQEGRALARLTDLGWGRRLHARLADTEPDAAADQALIAACIEVLRQWDWERRPVAVAAVPARRRPLLVDSVARALAEVGRLPWLGTLEPTRFPDGRVGPRQREGGANSAWRLADVWEGFTVPPEVTERYAATGGGPVLLVDDAADSRWTLTVAARALRRAGIPAVLPFVLAVAG